MILLSLGFHLNFFQKVSNEGFLGRKNCCDILLWFFLNSEIDKFSYRVWLYATVNYIGFNGYAQWSKPRLLVIFDKISSSLPTSNWNKRNDEMKITSVSKYSLTVWLRAFLILPVGELLVPEYMYLECFDVLKLKFCYHSFLNALPQCSFSRIWRLRFSHKIQQY